MPPLKTNSIHTVLLREDAAILFFPLIIKLPQSSWHSHTSHAPLSALQNAPFSRQDMILQELSYGNEEEEVLMKYGLQFAFEAACHFEEMEIIS